MKSFDGSRWPVFYPTGHGAFRLDELRRVRRVIDEFPSNMLFDKFVVEASGRVVGMTNRDRIYVQDPADGRFRPLETRLVERFRHGRAAAWITVLAGTLISSSGGVYLLQGDSLVPVEALSTAAIGEISQIFDLPRYRSAALSTLDGRLILLDSGGRTHPVAAIVLDKDKDWLLRVVEIEGGLLAQGNRDNFFVPMQARNDGFVPSAAQRFARIEYKGQPSHVGYHEAIGQHLVFGAGSRVTHDRLWRVAGSRLMPVEGSDSFALKMRPFVHNISSRRTVIIRGEDLYRYDGLGAVKRIDAERPSGPVSWHWVDDLPSVGLVIARGQRALMELTADDRIVPIALPPELDGATIVGIVELPASHVAVVLTDRGVFALDSSRTLTRIQGSARVEGRSFSPYRMRIPVREELFFSARNGHFLVLDQRLAGAAACAAAD